MSVRGLTLLLIILLGVFSMKAYPTIGDEAYTAIDDVLIPDPPLPYDANRGQVQPWVINSEQVQFGVMAALAKDKNKDELDTDVYISHRPEDRNTKPERRAGELLKQIAVKLKAQPTVIEQGPLKLPGVSALGSNPVIEPWQMTVESNGLGVISPMGVNTYSKKEVFVQRFYILPISRDEVVTVLATRNKLDDAPNTQFTTQLAHFLKTLKREVANTRSTTEGESYRTRRYFTHAFSFEIFKPNAEKGDQWYIETAERSVTWKTPQGEINFSITADTHKDFLDQERANKRHKTDAEARLEYAPYIAKESKNPIPVMAYLEKPLGTATFYGYREENPNRYDEKDVSKTKVNIRLASVYKPGKNIAISINGSKAAIEAHEKLIYKWLADFKFIP